MVKATKKQLIPCRSRLQLTQEEVQRLLQDDCLAEGEDEVDQGRNLFGINFLLQEKLDECKNSRSNCLVVVLGEN